MIAFVFGLIILCVLQVASMCGYLDPQLIPSPFDIFKSFIEVQDGFLDAFWSTFKNSFLGFVLSAHIGFFSGLMLFSVPILRRGLLPFAVFFQTVPIIAIAPLLVIYFGFGDLTIVTSTLIVGFFPMVASVCHALESTPSEYIDLFQFYRAGFSSRLLHLHIPMSCHGIFSGLKITAGLCVIGAVAGEFVAGSGLGAMIDIAKTQQRVDIVYLCIFGLSLIGLTLLFLVYFLEFLILQWRPFYVSKIK